MNSKSIENIYGNKIRIRASGLLFHENKILLIKHLGIGSEGYYWLPPGGGQEENELLSDTVKREFMEETSLEVEVKNLVYLNEFIQAPLHAVEFYFKVEILNNKSINLKLGNDPEMPENKVLNEIKWFKKEQLKDNCPKFLLDLQFDD